MKSSTLLGGSMIFPDWPNQRFGQAFVNKFAKLDGPILHHTGSIAHPELFYEENLNDAKELAWQKYVDVHGSSSQ
mgnify:CR=1 FL=1